MSRRIVPALAGLALLSGLAVTPSMLANAATAQDADPVEGVWITSDGEGRIEISRQADSLVGTILGGPKDDNSLDDNNPDPALRSRKLTGLRILQGFEREASGKWVDGTIYDPNNGKTYGCTIELENDSTLKVRGYLGVSLLGRTERWTRSTLVSTAASPDADPVEGVWITGDGEGYIEIRRQGDSLVGTILGGTEDDNRLDDNNPDPALRSRKLTGLQILQGFEREAPGKWVDGTIYDPNNGKTYGCTLELEDDGTLKVRGYLGVSLLGRTEKWTRKPDRE